MGQHALVTGGAGQDGWYLIELLLRRGYAVHAHSRGGSPHQKHAGPVTWHDGDLSNPTYLKGLLDAVHPTEIYNLAAISRPMVSWDIPLETAMLNAVVPQLLCDLLQRHHPDCRLFQASSSEIFGDVREQPQNEDTPLDPQTPYGISKAFAHRIVRAYRRRYNLRVSCGIMFNHESPLRPLTFVSQKIAHAAAAISLGLRETAELDERGRPIVSNGRLQLGDIEVRRDFGFAGDFVEAMYLIVQNNEADDFVIGTGKSHSIAQFCQKAFEVVGLDWRDYVSIDPSLIRKADTHFTQADASKLRTKLNWTPQVDFAGLVAMMVESRLAALRGKAVEYGVRGSS